MEETIAKKIDSYFTQFKHQVYKKGEILIRADDKPAGIFYLKKGIVKEYAISKKGDELVVNIFKPISFFPMSWAINNTANMYYFEAVTKVEVWRAPKENALEFIKKNPDVLYDLLKRVYIGIDGLLMRMAYLMSGNAYARIITEFIIHAKRFGEKGKGEEVVITNTSEQDVANRAGITRETVSRELKILKEKGLITFKKGVFTIPDLKKLEMELL